MPLPAVVALFAVCTLGGAVIQGVFGAICGAGFAVVFWANEADLREALKRSQEPGEREPFRLHPNDLIYMIPLAVALLYVVVSLFKGGA